MNDKVETTPAAITRVGRTDRIRARLVTWGLAVTLMAGLAPALTPAVAQAAGTTANDVKVCFTWANGTAYANKPVNLYTYRASARGWVAYRSGRTNASGCGVFADVAPNNWYAAQGYYLEPCSYGQQSYWVGWTGSAYVGPNSNTTVRLPFQERVTGPYFLSVC